MAKGKKRRAGKRRNKKGRGPPARGGTRGSFVTRPLSAASIPKPDLQFQMRSATVEGRATNIGVARGCEVIAQINVTNNYATPVAAYINPANPQFAPRLSAVALAYERYRIRKLKVRYHPGCPATLLGALGILVDFDASDEPPVSMVEIADNEAGAIGTVTAPLEVSATWPKVDDWFYTANDNVANSGESDPLWRWPGRLWVVTRDAGANDGYLAGYVSIEYEFEFMRLKAVAPQSFVAAISNLTLPVPGTSSRSQFLKMNAEHQVGWWDWFKGTADYGTTAVGIGQRPVPSDNEISYQNSVGAGAGHKINSSFAIDFGAESVSAGFESPREHKQVCKHWFNPAFVREGPVPLGGPWEPPEEPLAANDVVITLLCLPLAGLAASTVAVWTVNDPAAFNFARAVGYTVATACRLIFRVVIPDTDIRSTTFGRVTHVTIEEVD